MIRAYTKEQIRAAEAIAIGTRGEPALMAAASRAVANTALRRLAARLAAKLPDGEARLLPGRRAVLLVGSGNNGGDALYAGAFLRARGLRVTAVLTDPARAHAGGLAALRRRGGRIVGADADSEVRRLLATADVIIDGLVGLAAEPPLRPPADRLVALANAAAGLRVAVDLPSGIAPDSGATAGPEADEAPRPDAGSGTGPNASQAFVADVTVTIGAAKTGLLVAGRNTGDIEVAPIGMDPADLLPGIAPDAYALTDEDLPAMLPAQDTGGDKFSGGVVGIVAGSDGYPGAAVLATGGAVRIRPGLVRYAGPQCAQVLARWPEVVAAADPRSAGEVQAWAVGPGMGTDDTAAGVLRWVLGTDLPVLVDADGLTLLAADPGPLADRAGRGAETLLTPHDREFARLFPDLDLADRLGAVRAAARRSGATVLLKGSRTLIASPDGRTAVNMTASPWLATAGSGDVLTGIVGSLLAAGLGPLDAAAVGAAVHGRAGVRAAAAGAAGAQQLWFRLR